MFELTFGDDLGCTYEGDCKLGREGGCVFKELLRSDRPGASPVSPRPRPRLEADEFPPLPADLSCEPCPGPGLVSTP